MLVSDLVNVRYLSGFTGSNAALLVRADSETPVLATDGRYRTQAAHQAPDAEIVIERACGPHLAARAAKDGARRVGFVRQDLTVSVSPGERTELPPPAAEPGALERFGEQVLGVAAGLRAFGALVAEIARQIAAIAARRVHTPPGSLRHHIERMGVDAIFIVALLSFLTGMTMAFQGAVQLQRFGAGVFVADLIGMSMVRELVPLMTAVIITGRTGAAIAAELGTMRVRSEIDALATMGISPVRFLIVPRIAAITVVGPALTLIGMFIGILGGMLVAAVTLDMPPVTFWSRVVDRVNLLDFVHGVGKSLVFAWIIGLVGSHLGMRASGDASSVGTATTRTVVISVFLIIVVDAVFATITTVMKHGTGV